MTDALGMDFLNTQLIADQFAVCLLLRIIHFS